MNKLTYHKTKIYTLLGFDFLKTNEFYTEWFNPDIEDDTPPIQISQNYADKEFKTNGKNNN